MKYMIMLYGSQQDYDVFAGRPSGKPAKSAEELAAIHKRMISIHQELANSGELVYANGRPTRPTPAGYDWPRGFPW